MTETAEHLCPESLLAEAVATLERDEAAGRRAIDALARDFPHDPRLHFLGGSLEAAAGDYDSARRSMARAVELAPDYAIARFQYGLLLLTSGEAAEAEAALRPIAGLAPGTSLDAFAEGLASLARDAFGPAEAALERGLALPVDNASLHADMAMLLAELRARDAAAEAEPAGGSAAQLLLQQSALKARMH